MTAIIETLQIIKKCIDNYSVSAEFFDGMSCQEILFLGTEGIKKHYQESI